MKKQEIWYIYILSNKDYLIISLYKPSNKLVVYYFQYFHKLFKFTNT